MSTNELDHNCTPVKGDLPLAESSGLSSDSIPINRTNLKELIGHVRAYRAHLFVEGDFAELGQLEDALDTLNDDLIDALRGES